MRQLPAVIMSIEDLPEEAPWERLPGESTGAYRHFVLYREMDPTVRSVPRVAYEVGKSPGGQVRTWSGKFFWRARVEKWDEYLDEQARDAQIAAVRDGASVRAHLALGIFEKLYDRVVGKEPVVDENGELLERGVVAIDPERLDAKDIAALGGIAGKLLTSAEEHSGVKPLDEQRVNVTLAFDLDGAHPQVAVVSPSEADQPPATRELPPGQPEAA